MELRDLCLEDEAYAIMQQRIDQIRKEIIILHKESKDTCMREWFYEHHVAVVTDYSEKIARRENADVEISILSALFHDIARTWGTIEDPLLMAESLEKTQQIMKKYGYSEKKIVAVHDAIIDHSCRAKLPKTKEGKVLATADALAHLMTDFYFELPFNQWLTASNTFDGYKTWVCEKIERDFHKKIFFSEEKVIAKERYEAFKTLFSEANNEL